MTAPTRKRTGCSPWAYLGCGCGTVAILGILFVFYLLSVHLLMARKDPRWNTVDYAACQEHVIAMKGALERYQVDFHHRPARLEELAPRYLDAQQLHCPLETHGSGGPYAYTPDPGHGTGAPLITCRNHGQGPLILRQDLTIQLPRIIHVRKTADEKESAAVR